ncbi:hypothetical protein VTI74DRAFT_11367 [Chaetomium olivicolor]
MNTDTILMGDATDPPTLKAAAGFSGDPTLLSGQDPTTQEKGELSFAVGLKNLVLDTTNIPGGQQFTALWWGVAQGAHLQNVKIRMPQSVGGNGHSGMRLGRGSTLSISDVRIEGGQVRSSAITISQHATDHLERHLAQRAPTSHLQEHLLLPKHRRHAY